MTAKQTRGARREDAAQVFRQFAWHLAGTLAGAKAAGKPRPAPADGRR